VTADRDNSGADATNIASGLPTLRAALSRARSRWRVNALLHVAVWSVLAGLVVFCALGAAAILSDDVGRRMPQLMAHPTLDHIAKILLVFVSTFGLAAIVCFLRTPELAAHARAADQTFALKERLSTALEVADTLPQNALPDPVRQALLADAEQRARLIDVRALVPLRLPRAVWAVPALLLTAILLGLMPPEAYRNAASGTMTSPDASQGDGLTRQQAEDAAVNLRRIVDILERDAAQRSDPYLRSLARTLERLSTDIAEARIDRPRLASELNTLLAHAEQAYGDRSANQNASRQNATELLRSALNDIKGNRQTAETPARDADSTQDNPAEPKSTARPTQPPDRRPNNAAAPAQQSAAAAALKRLGVDISWLLVDEDGNEVDPRSQVERLMAEEERRARGGGQPAGAATAAGQGDGDQAGDGVHPLGRGNAKSTELRPTEQMFLPDPSGRDGARIRIELPPNVAQSDVASPTSDASGGWRRVPEQPVERPELQAEGRRILGRYFKRAADGQPNGEPGARDARIPGRRP